MEQLKQEVVVDLLRAWIEVYDTAEAIYRAFPEEIRTWIDEHGHRVESLVPVVAMMQPDVRVLCLSLVEDGLAALEAPLSHPVDTVEGAVEDVAARAKSGGEEMGGVVDRIAVLEKKAERLEAFADRLEALIGQLLADDAPAPPGASRSDRTGPRDERSGPLAG